MIFRALLRWLFRLLFEFILRRFLTLALLLAVALPVFALQPAIATADLQLILEEYLDASEPGAVVFLDDAGDTFVAAFGAADIDTGTAIATDDLFRIGSVTKPLVATTAIALAEEGAFELDDRLADYLPPTILDGIENADTATIRQALQMTSGIFNYTESDAFDDAVAANPSYMWTAAETVAFAVGEPSYFDPGEDYYYSNTNYNLIQLLVEETSGLSLAEALAAYVFEPAGMNSCYLETPDRFAQGIVRGYGEWDDGELYDITEENDGVGLGDGGVVCSAADLAKFPVALVNGDLLSEAALDEMLDAVADGDGSFYGLGIGYDEDTPFGPMISHDGATSGFQSTMIYLLDEDVTVTVLTNNFDADYVEDIALDVLDVLFYGG